MDESHGEPARKVLSENSEAKRKAKETKDDYSTPCKSGIDVFGPTVVSPVLGGEHSEIASYANSVNAFSKLGRGSNFQVGSASGVTFQEKAKGSLEGIPIPTLSNGPNSADMAQNSTSTETYTSTRAVSGPNVIEPNPLDIIIQSMVVWYPRGRNRNLGSSKYNVELPSDNEDEQESVKDKEEEEGELGKELALVLGDGLRIRNKRKLDAAIDEVRTEENDLVSLSKKKAKTEEGAGPQKALHHQ